MSMWLEPEQHHFMEVTWLVWMWQRFTRRSSQFVTSVPCIEDWQVISRFPRRLLLKLFQRLKLRCNRGWDLPLGRVAITSPFGPDSRISPEATSLVPQPPIETTANMTLPDKPSLFARRRLDRLQIPTNEGVLVGAQLAAFAQQWQNLEQPPQKMEFVLTTLKHMPQGLCK